MSTRPTARTWNGCGRGWPSCAPAANCRRRTARQPVEPWPPWGTRGLESACEAPPPCRISCGARFPPARSRWARPNARKASRKAKSVPAANRCPSNFAAFRLAAYPVTCAQFRPVRRRRRVSEQGVLDEGGVGGGCTGSIPAVFLGRRGQEHRQSSCRRRDLVRSGRLLPLADGAAAGARRAGRRSADPLAHGGRVGMGGQGEKRFAVSVGHAMARGCLQQPGSRSGADRRGRPVPARGRHVVRRPGAVSLPRPERQRLGVVRDEVAGVLRAAGGRGSSRGMRHACCGADRTTTTETAFAGVAATGTTRTSTGTTTGVFVSPSNSLVLRMLDPGSCFLFFCFPSSVFAAAGGARVVDRDGSGRSSRDRIDHPSPGRTPIRMVLRRREVTR